MKLAGFTDDEVDDIAKMGYDALEERKAAVKLAQEAAGAASRSDGDRFEHGRSRNMSGSQVVGPRVVVAPEQFTFVKYDAGEIAEVVTDLAERIGLANPIRVVVDETTPMAAMSSTIDGTSSDALITIHVESGALEDTKHFTNFNRHHAEISLGRMLLRAHDRLRPDFADAPNDESLEPAGRGVVEHLRQRSTRPPRRGEQPATVAVQLPQPVRFQRRRRRPLRRALERHRPRLVRPHHHLTTPPTHPDAMSERADYRATGSSRWRHHATR